MVTSAAGLPGPTAPLADSRVISSLSEISRIADSSLVLASESSLELRSSPVSVCAWRARESLSYSFSLRYSLIFF